MKFTFVLQRKTFWRHDINGKYGEENGGSHSRIEKKFKGNVVDIYQERMGCDGRDFFFFFYG